MEFKFNTEMNWEEQFKMMKRWYYRLKGNTHFGSAGNYSEDFFISFFITCHSFPEWLIKDKVATQQEVDECKSKNKEIIQLCKEIANFSKHKELDKKHTDPNTSVRGQKFSVPPSSGPLARSPNFVHHPCILTNIIYKIYARETNSERC